MVTRTPRRARSTVPAFALYGEARPVAADMLHIESLQSRSRLYQWEIDVHLHRGLHQIIWLRAGPAEVSLEARTHQCAGPLIVVIPPGAVHGFRFAAETDGQVLTLSPRSLVEGDRSASGDALLALFATPCLLPLEGDDAQRIGTLFDNLAAEFNAPGSGGSPVPVWLARALVWRLADLRRRHVDGRSTTQRGPSALFTRFLALVEAHYTEHWTVARHATQLGLTAERLNRLTRSEAGRSAQEIIHDRLAREACRRVAYVAAPISRLAFELGFEDPAYFCRFFKRHTGQTPRAFRAQAGA